MDSDAIYYSSLSAIADLIKHGWTTAFDHQYSYPRHAGKELVGRQMDAAEMMGRKDIGTLEAGKGADLFMIDTEKLEYSGI